jgi:hypothetical protein
MKALDAESIEHQAYKPKGHKVKHSQLQVGVDSCYDEATLMLISLSPSPPPLSLSLSLPLSRHGLTSTSFCNMKGIDSDFTMHPLHLISSLTTMPLFLVD